MPLHFHREEQTLSVVLSSVNMQITVDQLLEEITKASYNKNILNTVTNFKRSFLANKLQVKLVITNLLCFTYYSFNFFPLRECLNKFQ